ncbi:GAF domain-containing sensor histidine kinase [Streptomyces erythrochromogenes]|uniref:GAF domain-containing sensor histidine kinase n=1 Tax=Streptomyces erythrochromogenes TaxID=285574 RepID=UPI0036AA8976
MSAQEPHVAPPWPRLDVPDRVQALLSTVMDLGRGLELPQVLKQIVEAAVTLTDAEYGALGVVGDGQQLSQFLPVGMADDLVARIGRAPCGRGILGELIRHPVPLRLADLTRHPGSHGFPDHHPPMRTFLGVPVRVREEVFGNLYLTEKRGAGGFDAEDEAIVTTLSIAAGIAIDNARLYDESRRREHSLEALGEITRTLLAGTHTGRVLSLIARKAMEVADADLVAVLLPTASCADEAPLTVEVALGEGAPGLQGRSFPAHGSLAGLAARTGTTVVSPDAGDSRLGEVREAHGPAVAVPLPVDAARCGALRLSRSAGRPGFDDSEVRLISRFADQAAIALELAQRRAEGEELAVLHDRDRIARDLHDVAIQRLFATGMTLQSTTGMIIDAPAKAAERVERAVDDLDGTVQIIRSTIFELRSSDAVRGGAGLRRRLPEVTRIAAQALGFPPALRIDGPIDSCVPEELADHVLAVVAEALSNTARHARASQADVDLTVRETQNRLTLTVTDDGVGVAGAHHTGGLLNMRSRAEEHGGAMTAESPLAGGTRIVWHVPLTAS